MLLVVVVLPIFSLLFIVTTTSATSTIQQTASSSAAINNTSNKIKCMIELYQDGKIRGPLIKHNAKQDFCEVSSKLLDFVKLSAPPFFDSYSRVNNVRFNTIYDPNNNDDDTSQQQQLLRIPIDQLTSNIYIIEKVLTDTSIYKLDEQIFGQNGEYTQQLIEQHQLLLDFWNVSITEFPIFFTGAQSEVLQYNMEDAIQSWLLVEGYHAYTNTRLTIEELIQVANSARNAIETELPNTYSNSVLSLDALFFPFHFDNIPDIDKKSILIFGDGMLDFVQYLGDESKELGAAIIHAHEFSHYLQFILDIENLDGNIELYYELERNATSYITRQNELEADAMAAYVLAHEHGRNFNVTSLITTSNIIYHFGDCDTNEQGHHGSPKQRKCAIRWGADTGLDLTGPPISPLEFRVRFYKNLDGILSSDPSTCSITVGESGDENNEIISTNGGNNNYNNNNTTTNVSSTTRNGSCIIVTYLFLILVYCFL